VAILWADPRTADPVEAFPPRLQIALQRLRHADIRELSVGTRALVAVLVLWVPLIVLAALERLTTGASLHVAVLLDFRVYGRYLVAAPLFILAEAICLPELVSAVGRFRTAGLVADADLARYDALAASTRRLLAARWTVVVLIACAYGFTLPLLRLVHSDSTTTWIFVPGTTRVSLAGWWRALISQPLFLVLLGTWFWRLLIWIRFLWSVGRIDLRLVAPHPDRLAVLRFVLLPRRGFSILAMAIGAMGAGEVATRVVVSGEPLATVGYFIAGQIVAVVVIFAAPLWLLTSSLIRMQARGIAECGSFTSPLDARDVSPLTDLLSAATNIRAINFFVLDLKAIGMLIVASLVPYLPIIVTVAPMRQLLDFFLRSLA
jgi:hypothetical protein